MKYKFITFEGVEGCGKSTQAKLLFDSLTQRNISATLTREPGGTVASEKIREILLSDEFEILESKTESFLNFAARIEHVEKLIKPKIEKSEVVICDRFFDSTIAYQGYGFGNDIDQIQKLNEIAIESFAPDITFLIDIDTEKSFARIKDRKSNNRYERLDMDFHKRVRAGFLEIAKINDRIRIIDGNQNISQIAKQIFNFVLEK
jgi:dTMP kinase